MPSRLSWEEKFAAVLALGDASLKMRAPGDWYVSQSVDVKESINSGVIGNRFGNGATPEAAVEDHFDSLTGRAPFAYLVMRHAGGMRRHLMWNGFMWVDHPSSPALVG